jgi:hypothetical protein
MSEVAEATETADTEDSLAATFAEWNAKIEEAHSAPPVEEEQAENEPEQTPSDDDSAEVVAGDEQEVTETPEPEVIPEGPSFLMKQEAARAGVDPKFIAVAKDDAQLEQMIVAVSRDADVKEELLPEFSLTIDLPEDEYPADDPIRKQLEKITAAVVERVKLNERYIGSLAQIETERMEREERSNLEAKQREYTTVATPFDQLLDSFNDPLLGKTGTNDPKQREKRVEIWSLYQGIGADAKQPPEVLSRKALKALEEVRPDLAERYTQNKKAAEAQARRVTGGKASTPVKGKSTVDQVYREWNAGLRNGSLPLE